MDFSKPPLSDIVETLRTAGLQILIIVIVAFVVLRVARLSLHGILKALLDREATEGTAQELSAIEVTKRLDTLDRLGGAVIRFFVIVIAGLMILTTVGIDIGPAVAGLGVVGIAVGFGAQSLVRDYLNGCLILIENQFSRGDVVSVAGVTGTVEDFSLRRTTLRDLDGVVHTVPNGEIKVASNRTRTWARINQNVVVAVRDRRRQGDRRRERGRPGHGRRPEVEAPDPPAAARRPRRVDRPDRRHHAEDPGHGSRLRPVGGVGRVPAEAADGVRRERNRDPGPTRRAP